MWFDADFNRIAVEFLPSGLRKPALSAFVQSVIKPITKLNYTWSQNRLSTIYKLEHTGQVCYLRKALNDNFDPELRRIYIGNGNVNQTPYIYTEAEAQNQFTGTEAEETTFYLRTEAETADTGLDFIVWVPETILNEQFYGLHALVDFYKAGGKRYNILPINDE
ncbi:hypothetical protein [Flavobacterium beibuense]|uniref:hypothetical protein n=1 Tax=Flavobacterium beibuense TaxID=657326 RepID=UPI003A94F89F